MYYDIDVFNHTPERLMDILSSSCKKRRLEKGWSRKTLSENTGVPVPTISKFEACGKISLESFLRIVVAFDYFEEMSKVLSEAKFHTGEELDAINRNKSRQRGR